MRATATTKIDWFYLFFKRGQILKMPCTLLSSAICVLSNAICVSRIYSCVGDMSPLCLHAELEESKYKEASKANQDEDAKKWFNQFVWEISRLSVSEELVMYPMIESAGGKGKTLADKSRADHHQIKEMLEEMSRISDPLAIEGKMDMMMTALRDGNCFLCREAILALANLSKKQS